MLRLWMVAVISVASIASGETNEGGTWLDPAHELVWTSADSGIGVTFSQANYYCKNLTLGGYKDWALPTIDELQTLFGGPLNEKGFHVLGPLKLTGWEWSSSLGKSSGEAWGFDFGDGARSSLMMGESGLNRALCVRHEGKSN